MERMTSEPETLDTLRQQLSETRSLLDLQRQEITNLKAALSECQDVRAAIFNRTLQLLARITRAKDALEPRKTEDLESAKSARSPSLE
jgi:hypothetical protein